MIRPNDTVLHKPSGETWVVCGVDHSKDELIPCGYPFPNYDIFGNLSEPPEIKHDGNRYKTMQELHGIKEGNDTCKTCDHLMNGYYHGKSYYKCELWIVSHSSATDIIRSANKRRS